MRNVELYPRGYVGPSISGETGGGQPPGIGHHVQVARNTLDVDLVVNKGERPHDKYLDALYDKYMMDSSNMLKFSFREEVLKKAKQLLSFNGQISTYQNFLACQFTHGEISLNHAEALKEITNFIITGEQGFKITTWERLVDRCEDVDLLYPAQRAEYSKKLNQQCTPIMGDLSSTISEWVSKSGGYEHMLRSMCFLFGKNRNFPTVDVKE